MQSEEDTRCWNIKEKTFMGVIYSNAYSGFGVRWIISIGHLEASVLCQQFADWVDWDGFHPVEPWHVSTWWTWGKSWKNKENQGKIPSEQSLPAENSDPDGLCKISAGVKLVNIVWLVKLMDLFIPVSLRIFAKIVAQPQESFLWGNKKGETWCQRF